METFGKKSITARSARAAVEAAESHAQQLGALVAVAIVDDGGSLKAFTAMDGAAASAGKLAYAKARSAASYRMATDQWIAMFKDDPASLRGIANLPDIIMAKGGVPIADDGAVIGAIGVSGGYPDQDGAIAVAALATTRP